MASKLLQLRTLHRYNQFIRKEYLPILSSNIPFQYQNTQKRHYKDFSHKPTQESTFSKVVFTIFTFGIVVSSLNFEW